MNKPNFKDFGKHWNKRRLGELWDALYDDYRELIEALCEKPKGYCDTCEDTGTVSPDKCIYCHGEDDRCSDYDGQKPCQYFESCPACNSESEAK